MAICVECRDEYNDKRRALGYFTCLECGDRHAKSVKRTVVPMNKSNYILVTDPSMLCQLNPKRTL